VSRLALNGHDNDDEDPFAPVEEDSDDDPFAKGVADGEESSDSERENGLDTDIALVDGEVAEDEDEEIDSDEAFGDEDVAMFKSFKFLGSNSLQSLKRKTKIGRAAATVNLDSEEMDGDLQSENLDRRVSEGEDLESEEDVKMVDEDFSSEAEDSDDDSASIISTSPETLGGPTSVSSDRAALKAILANDTAAVASTLSAAADSDAKKGKAVRQQYQTFDRLLDARIKLQKGLTAANDLTQESFTESENELAIQKAEEAALSLWSTIESIRHSLLDAQLSSTGSVDKTKKRKRLAPATAKTSTRDLWSRTESLETQSLPHHCAVLDKWSAKARAATALPAPRSQLIDRSSQNQNNITAVLETYLASESDKLVAQASITPRSPPTTTTQTPSQLAYDDTSFYQSLLRDLIASRSSNPSTALTSTSTALLPSTTRFHDRGSKNKRVDTKASKGRKVRYTVHEKLQNFAAEEERGTWEESARREFFGSLFGARRMLDENEQDGTGDGATEEGMVDGEAEALRLFRN
jgi:protein AATF/BFR2